MANPRTALTRVVVLWLTVVLGATIYISVVRAEPHTQALAPITQTPSDTPLLININTASAAELEQLPGIGPSRAAAIVALRQRLGRFKDTSELIRVRGIGRTTYRNLRAFVTVGSAQGTRDVSKTN